ELSSLADKRHRSPFKRVAHRLLRLLGAGRRIGKTTSMDRIDIKISTGLTRDSGCALSQDDDLQAIFAPHISNEKRLTDLYKPSLEEKRMLATLILAQQRRVQNVMDNFDTDNTADKA